MLALHEFDGLSVPWAELAPTNETELAKKILPGVVQVDFGLFKLKRVYEKDSKQGLSRNRL
jgi:hypothetical protein